jgi:hypothetical protein
MRHSADAVTYQGMTKALLPLVLLATILGGAALVRPTRSAVEPVRLSENGPTTLPTEPVPAEPTLPTQPGQGDDGDDDVV